MELFFRDSSSDVEITWSQLLADLNIAETYNPYCNSNNFYCVFKQIIISLIYGEEIILLDSDFTSQELTALTGYSDVGNFSKSFNGTDQHLIKSKSDLLERIKVPRQSWAITLFTSGTTGLPKKVSHTFESITRFVKISEKNSDDIWGFAFNPTHFAGIQVFFQALLNGNTLIRLFGLSKEQIFNEVNTYSITNISATPSFYRLLLPSIRPFSSVTRITTGGEKFDNQIINQLKSIFPNAKITNVYASTEAGTLFASDGEIFTIKHGMQQFVRFDNGELLIHQRLIKSSDNNNDDWYHTGDLVEMISENPPRFRFISRRNEMINVGGYKVNPAEVEETIRSIPGINDARVYPKPNSVLGYIVCCEIIKSDMQLDETFIRSWLQTKLQEYKIPRMIRFVDTLSTTRSGKLKRTEP